MFVLPHCQLAAVGHNCHTCQSVTKWCSVVQCGAMCASVSACFSVLQCCAMCWSVLPQYAAAVYCCSVLQCAVAVCRSELPCLTATCCGGPRPARASIVHVNSTCVICHVLTYMYIYMNMTHSSVPCIRSSVQIACA